MVQTNHHHRTGMTRREMIQAGYSGLVGIGLPTILGARCAAAHAVPKSLDKPKSILIVFLTGAASHHDTFDMKPDAPGEIRGEFKPVSTSVPGIQICEHLPHIAARAHQYAIVRSLSHNDNNHLMSTHHVLTGTKQPGGFFDKVASRDDWPCYASGAGFLKPREDGIPCGVNLPTFLMGGPLTWPGQHSGFVGPRYDPWQITQDPNKANFKLSDLTLAQGVDVTRLKDRQSLLTDINRQQIGLERSAQTRRLSDEQELAFSILTSSKLADSFKLDAESEANRERYGRTTTGQSLLLARRLIEAGVPVVQVNVGAVQTWDNHQAIFKTLKDRLLPPLDKGMGALLDDLRSSGLIDDTLVMMLGEFGRTPKINKTAGRDHWGPCFFGLFAGAGVQGGQVIGKSDKTGAYPVSAAYAPDDVGATVYDALGIQPEAEVHDRFGRPVRLNRGSVIAPLYTGRNA